MDNRCKRCEIFYAAEETAQAVEAAVEKLPAGERAGEETVEERVALCAACEQYLLGTCLACGCYVLFRASQRRGRCPKKKWQIKD
ncbi:MAG: DUF6171 family protein [bacterium]